MITMQFTGYPTGKKIEKVKTRFPLAECQSVHVPQTAVSRNQAQNTDTKIWPIVRGLYGYGDKITNLVSLKNDGGYAELIDIATGDMQIAVYMPQSNTFTAAECTAAGAMSAYNTSGQRKGSVLLAAFIAARYHLDGEMQNCISGLNKYAALDDDADDWDDPILCDDFGKMMCMLSSNIYYTIDKNVIPTTLRSGNISQIEKTVEKILFCPNGSPAKISVNQPAVDCHLKQGEYSLNEKRVYTGEEKARMVNPSDAYVTPTWVRSVCKKVKESTRFKQPFRNVLLTGPSGTGKTSGAVAIAFALGQPYAKVTCGPDTDFFDLIGQMLPNTEQADTKAIFKELNLPSFEDVENDFAGSYKKLFGKEPGKLAQPADCYTEIMNRVLSGIQTTKDFTYVESDLLKAVENGWVIEIQEPTVIKRSSVLVGLNSILETDSSTASITLPTGKVIRRHPDTVVVMTTNSDYEGCGKIQQSVLSRMDIVMQIENPSTEDLVERTKEMTGFKTKFVLSKMANVVREINDFCKTSDIRDGVCGPRELKNWAQEAILRQVEEDGSDAPTESSVISALFPTLLAKVSQSPEDIEEVITGVINKYYNQNEVQEAKEAYLKGY